MSKLFAASLFVFVACGGSSNGDGNGPPDAPPDMPPDLTSSVAIHLDPPSGTPLVAFQDGDGAWQVASGSHGVYTARVHDNRYAVAVACPSVPTIAALPFVHQYYRTLEDGRSLDVVGCTTSLDDASITINLSGVLGADAPLVWIGSAVGGGRRNIPIVISAARGKSDVFIMNIQAGGTPDFYRGPTIDVQADQTIDVAVSGTQPEVHAITAAGLAADTPLAVDTYYATSYSHGLWPMFGTREPNEVSHYTTLGAYARQPGDLTNVRVGAPPINDNGVVASRYVQLDMAAPIDLSVDLPAAWLVTPPTIIDAATAQTSVTLPITPSTLGIVDYTITFRSVFYTSLIELHATSGWVGTAGSSSTITTPDLSHLPGWLPEMGIHPGSQLDWFIYRDDRNMPAATPPTDGRRISSNSLNGSLTPP